MGGNEERPRRGSGVRAAIVDTASVLFSEHGIRAVSADRVLANAGYSKVTFYRHFPTKDDLVVAYLERELERVRALLDEAARTGGLGTSAMVADALTEEMCRPHFRGCPFINAAAEYPDATHPVRRVVSDFRALMTSAIAAWVEARGASAPASLADRIMMLRDGALVAGYLSGDSPSASRELARSLDALLAAAGAGDAASAARASA